ncbi:unnamed protein product, partial [Coccothraustes coccothraustes]
QVEPGPQADHSRPRRPRGGKTQPPHDPLLLHQPSPARSALPASAGRALRRLHPAPPRAPPRAAPGTTRPPAAHARSRRPP